MRVAELQQLRSPAITATKNGETGLAMTDSTIFPIFSARVCQYEHIGQSAKSENNLKMPLNI